MTYHAAIGVEHLIVHYFVHWLRDQAHGGRDARFIELGHKLETAAGFSDWCQGHPGALDRWAASPYSELAQGWLGAGAELFHEIQVRPHVVHIVYAAAVPQPWRKKVFASDQLANAVLRLKMALVSAGPQDYFVGPSDDAGPEALLIFTPVRSTYRLRIWSVAGDGTYRLKVANGFGVATMSTAAELKD